MKVIIILLAAATIQSSAAFSSPKSTSPNIIAMSMSSQDPVTLFDTKFSLYCQLGRMVMYENDIDFISRYVDLPNGEQLEPWYARINPKMIIPSVQLPNGEIVNDSRNIMKLFDKKCPKDQEEKVEKVMDIAYSCDLGWFSTVAMKNKIWLWKKMQDGGVMENITKKTIQKLADDPKNADLRDIYLKKLEISTADLNSQHNLNRQAPIQKCLDDLDAVLAERKEGEWSTGPVFTRADVVIAIYTRWVKWQLAWNPKLLNLPPRLEAFYNEVKDRPTMVKTLDVEPQWVGFYWYNRLIPVQRALSVAAAATVTGIVFAIKTKGLLKI